MIKTKRKRINTFIMCLQKNYIEIYMHEVSKMVITYAKENKCKGIVIGIKDIKKQN